METKTEKILTGRWGKVDPFRIDDCLESGGYAALGRFVEKGNPESAIAEIRRSGLAGRGGAGFPTARKLELVAANRKKEKYFICNLDESEPGTYKDREIAENDPHLLIEGVALAALIVGARKAFIYVNGNYAKAKEILEHAIAEAERKRLIGPRMLGTEYDLEVTVFQGAGAYVCGEETALIDSIEGRRGEPRLRSVYPTEAGLFGCPTAVNNAETVANLPWILENGGERYSKIGSENHPGTKLYTLGGSVRNKGVFEAPTGMSVRELIFGLGGGMEDGKEFWFAQIGGASGRLLLEAELDERLDFSRDAKASLGSGAILAVDRSVDIHDLLLSWTGFFRRESCGKCVPCREGNFRLSEIAKRMRNGKIGERDKANLTDILWTLERTTFCPLGKFSAIAVRDAIEKLGIFDK